MLTHAPPPNSLFAVWPLAFGSGWMMLLGIFAAVPVIIHLLSRRRYTEVVWAAMEYLLAALRKNARRIQLEQLLLLIVRALILLVLAFALADASCTSSSRLANTFVPTGGTTHHVLVIDGSYSMQYRDEDQTRFERAQELASALVKSSKQGDGFTLVMLADPPRSIVAAPAYDPADVVDEINALVSLDGSGDLTATLGEVEKILETARREHPRLTRNRVYFFSDLGRTTWGAATTDTGAGRVAALGQRATLLLLDLGQPDANNLAVTALTQLEPYVTAGREITYQAQIKNLGSQKVSQQSVEFLVDDRRVDEERIDLASGEEATVAFNYRFDRAQDHVTEVRLAKDHLPVDDRRWLSVPVAESLKVLCIAGKPGSAQYVAWSLQPSKSDRPTVRPEVASEIALLERELSEYDCVFLCNVGRFGRDEADVLYNYLKGGGGLVVFLGDQVLPDSYNLELGGELAGHRVLPASIGELVKTAETESRFFDPGDYEHPIVEPFRGFERTGLLSTPVWRYYRLKPDSDPETRVALRFDNGDPAIVEHPVEQGRCILVATAGSDASVDASEDPPMPWTAISAWHSFPPLVHEMLVLAAGGRFAGRTVEVGRPLSAVLRTSAADVPLEVRGPADQSRRVRMSVDGEDSHWVYPYTHKSGVYRAAYGPPLSTEQVFAVNVNTAESDLSRVDTQMLPDELRIQTQIADNSRTAAMLSRGNEGRLYRWALAALLLLLFGETFLAWRFGSSP